MYKIKVTKMLSINVLNSILVIKSLGEMELYIVSCR